MIFPFSHDFPMIFSSIWLRGRSPFCRGQCSLPFPQGLPIASSRINGNDEDLAWDKNLLTTPGVMESMYIYIHRYDMCVYICFFPSRSQKRSTLRRSCLNSTAMWYLAVMADPPVKGYIAHGFASANEIHWWICWWTKITAIHAS